MTVQELIDVLKTFDGSLPVYVTSCSVDRHGRAFGDAGFDFPSPRTASLNVPEFDEPGRMVDFVLLDPKDAQN